MDSGTKVKKGAARRRSGGGRYLSVLVPELRSISSPSSSILQLRITTHRQTNHRRHLRRRRSRASITLRVVLELAGTLQELTKRTVAVSNDEELGTLLKGVTIAHSGVLPNKNPILLPKKSEKAATKQSQVTIKGYQIS
ncbi:unnamed protein product [Arabidopsis lyrata]|nr:unnamed protein product [Arabidopsis lyrata]